MVSSAWSYIYIYILVMLQWLPSQWRFKKWTMSRRHYLFKETTYGFSSIGIQLRPRAWSLERNLGLQIAKEFKSSKKKSQEQIILIPSALFIANKPLISMTTETPGCKNHTSRIQFRHPTLRLDGRKVPLLVDSMRVNLWEPLRKKLMLMMIYPWFLWIFMAGPKG